MDANREEFMEKAKLTCLDRYGVDSYFKTDEFISNYPVYWQRSRETCLDKYGVEFPIQNPIVFSKAQKSMFSKKKYTFPNGRVEYVRGYEPYCIDELLKEYSEEEIIVETVDIPTINYKKYGTGMNAVYYPDILLPDKLVEVKSKYIFLKDFENNIKKFRACINSGYKIEVRIYDEKANCIFKKEFNESNKNNIRAICKAENMYVKHPKVKTKEVDIVFEE
jgi:hypothetical protein